MQASRALVIGRIIFALAFWIASYNSTELNLFKWFMVQDISTQILAGLVWFGVAATMLAWSYSSIGKFGFIFLAALIAALLFFFFDQGLIDSLSTSAYQNIVPLSLGVVNAVALNWNDIRRKGSGAIATEDDDEV